MDDRHAGEQAVQQPGGAASERDDGRLAGPKPSGRARTFLLLATGALLFSGVYLVTDRGTRLESWSAAMFPCLFGLPFVADELRRRTNWLLVAYFLVWIPAAHYAAVLAAFQLAFPDDSFHLPDSRIPALFAIGAAGGMVGAAMSFLALSLRRLRASDARGIKVGAAGLVVLTAIGGAGYALGVHFDIDLGLILYLPWQLVFAFFLSRLLRPSPPRGG